MWLNLPEPVGGSSTSNLIQLVQLAPSLLLSPVKMQSEKVRSSRTTPNFCERHLDTFFSL